MCLPAMPDTLAQGTCRVIIFSLKNTRLHLFPHLLKCRALFTDMARLQSDWNAQPKYLQMLVAEKQRRSSGEAPAGSL